MFVPPHLLRVIFAVSTFAAIFVVVVPLIGRRAGTGNTTVYVGAIAVVVASGVCYVMFRHGRLVLRRVLLHEVIRAFVGALMVSYVALAMLIAIAFLLLLSLAGLPLQEAALFSVAVALWFPLWSSPAFAAVSTWRKLRSGGQNDV